MADFGKPPVSFPIVVPRPFQKMHCRASGAPPIGLLAVVDGHR